jgi:hypothetical protein
LTGSLLGGYIASLDVGTLWNLYVSAVVAVVAAVAPNISLCEAKYLSE